MNTDTGHTTIGMATIGHAPRLDVVPAMRAYLPSTVEIVERGALDGLEREQTAPYWADPGQPGIVTALRDGSSVLLSHARILPEMQRTVDRFASDDVDLIVVLCGADWSALRSEKLIVNPGTLFPAIISSLAAGKRLGIVKPDPSQVEKEHARYAALGIDAVVTAASPYSGPPRVHLARQAAETLRDAACDLIWMTCIGMDAEMRSTVSEMTGVPVILAHELLARVVTSLVRDAAVTVRA